MAVTRSDRLDEAAAPAGVDVADVRAAYERGRRDERASRKRHPLLMTLMFLAAAVGAAVLAVAAMQGSFARGGAVVDQNLSVAADKAEPAVRDAASRAGQALQGASDGPGGEPAAPAR